MSDWRETLFCWRGQVSVSSSTATWRGAWVGADDGALPADAAFADSPNKFELTASVDPAALGGQRVQFAGWYLLDNGDGAAKYEDHAHDVAFGAGTARATVVATGRNEFGRFVSRGTLDGATLTLCRRYVGERDPRLAEGPEAALESIMEPAAPWRALPFQPPATKRPRKRKKKTKALEVEDDAGGEGGAVPTPAASAPPPAAKTLEKPKRPRKCAPIIAVANFGGRRCGADGPASVRTWGVWDCDPDDASGRTPTPRHGYGRAFPWHFDMLEKAYVLEGSATLTPDDAAAHGGAITINAKDMVTFPKGWRGRWVVHSFLRKRYAFFDGKGLRVDEDDEEEAEGGK